MYLDGLMKETILFIILYSVGSFVLAQTYIPGNVYTDATGYVQYRAGNLPIIISAPHGGDLEPASIPDRNCAGCVTVKDSWTKEITEGIANQLNTETGCFPHVIINLLHRKKFDANRDVGDAANGNTTVIQSWNNYHNFINDATSQVIQDYGTGTFYDMHGHGHNIQRIELGYLITKTELQQSDSFINTNAATVDSSIRNLVTSNINNLTQAQLIRGSNSLGDILVQKGYPSIPSSSDPAPMGTDPYFSGGYNTNRHGSSDGNSLIDAIQIELNQSIRFDATARAILIDSLAQSMIDYHNAHYNDQFVSSYCNVLSNDDIPIEEQIKMYPNPVSDLLHIQSKSPISEYQIYNIHGQVMKTAPTYETNIAVSHLESGMYFIKAIMENGEAINLRFTKE